MHAKPFPFRGVPPERARDVLAQSAAFDVAAWQRGLPDRAYWPASLDHQVVADGWQHIDRQMVFDVGVDVRDPASTGRLFVACAVWGTGTAGRERVRRLRVFQQDAPYGFEELWHGIALVRESGPVDAYAYLHGRKRNRVPHVGPAFGTKVLYFSGYEKSATSLRPLILDSRVATALNMLCGWSWPTLAGGWTPSQYEQYLTVAHDWAKQWGTDPDVVEYVLFNIGKAPEVAVRSLVQTPD
jgi:hypothetical protein